MVMNHGLIGDDPDTKETGITYKFNTPLKDFGAWIDIYLCVPSNNGVEPEIVAGTYAYTCDQYKFQMRCTSMLIIYKCIK